MDTNCIIAISAFVSAIATCVIGYFSWQSARVSNSNLEIAKQIAWFTGAMESHSDLQLKLAAKAEGVEAIWWDPNLEPLPRTPKHGEAVQLSTIYMFLPRGLRVEKDKPPSSSA